MNATAPWRVLVVDDERSVLDVTRMVLERVRVDGRPLELDLCASATEATERLREREYAVAIVDVVMESEHAGLDLVRAVRTDPRHRLTQLVVRTGQPGAHPEAKVIESFDINAYWPKAEMTAARMRSSVTGLVRSHATASALERRLSEREVLLRELHHRVKNNLQILSSLLSLQSVDAEPLIQASLSQAITRIRAMGLVHQQLYAEQSLHAIDLGAYITQLAGDVAHSLGGAIEITCEVEQVEVEIGVAVPVGLIVNELVSNAIKYGRSSDGAYRVRTSVRATPGGFRVSVRDEGPGLADEPRPGKSLGWKLIQLLAKQLRAEVQVGGTGAPGTGAEVAIEVSHADASGQAFGKVPG